MKLDPFKIERYFARHEFTAPYLLCTSDCESMSINDLLAISPGAAERFGSFWLGYTESQGSPELRRAIAPLYEKVDEGQIIVHAGAEEAIFNFMNVALEPGDQAIVHAPFYQSLGEVARGVGAEVIPWKGDPERGWALDLEILKSLLTPLTKVVVVNFPHNPTGYLPAQDFAQELSELSEKHGFLIFADEVYRGLELDPADRLESFADLNERAVAMGVMSKAYGLGGLRIGWIATRNREIFEQMSAFKDYTTICSSGPSEFLATIALQHGEAIVARNLAIIRKNLDLLDSFFASREDLFRWQRPKAGSVAFPELLQGDADRFCEELVEKAGVLLLPGSTYEEGLNAFRVGFGRKNLPEALQRLAEHLDKT